MDLVLRLPRGVGLPHLTTYNGADVKIARLSVSAAEGDLSVMDMHYLVAEKDKGVTHFSDRHELGLFDRDRTLDMMTAAGLDAQFLQAGLMEDRGLLVGVKR